MPILFTCTIKEVHESLVFACCFIVPFRSYAQTSDYTMQQSEIHEFFDLSNLVIPIFDPPGTIPDNIREIARTRQPAQQDVSYLVGDIHPWRQGGGAEVIQNPDLIASEESRRLIVENEDRAAGEGHADSLRNLGVRVDFLLWMTVELQLWGWTTRDVVECLVKPATENFNRCRFSSLSFMQPFVGPATVFMSHVWDGQWVDLVAAACAGARTDRFVWIDVFAVRRTLFKTY
jgi:hypothetical protein